MGTSEATGRSGRLLLLVLLLLVAAGLSLRGMSQLEDEREATHDAWIVDELEAMRAADQRVRQLFLGKIEDEVARTEQRTEEINAEKHRLDLDHVARVSAILDELGEWPSPPRFDARAAQSACVIAVHATHDLDFMRRARDLMDEKAADGLVNVECWAQVTDRILVQTHRPQRFGTQFRGATIDGVFHFGVAPVEDPEGLAARRAEVGLGDYEEYLARQRRDYLIPPGTPDLPADYPMVPPEQTP